MKYFFILGRNPKLSRAELYLYLETRKINFEEVFFKENVLVLKLENKFNFRIQRFGGLLWLGKIQEFDGKKELLKFLEEKEFVEKDKFTYSIFGDVDSYVFSEKFKRERKKAQIKNFGKKLKLQSGEEAFMPRVDIEIFAYTLGKKIFLGLVEQKFSSKEVEKRDMKKPERRESLAISPRLAKILINLSGAKDGDLILDPFCGVGGVVQEAVLMGINCVGIDKDSEAIYGAKKNLSWLRKNYFFSSKYEFLNANSLNAVNKQYDAIVAESSLGELLKKKLIKEQAKKYLEEFKQGIVPLLKKFGEIKKRDAKIAITFPCFEGVEIFGEEISNLTGLKVYSSKLINFPLIEKRDRQYVNRQIWVFY